MTTTGEHRNSATSYFKEVLKKFPGSIFLELIIYVVEDHPRFFDYRLRSFLLIFFSNFYLSILFYGVRYLFYFI